MSSNALLNAMRVLAEAAETAESGLPFKASQQAEAVELAKRLLGPLQALAATHVPKRDEATIKALESGLFWENSPPHLTVLSSTIARLAVDSPFRWLPPDLIRAIASHAFPKFHAVAWDALPDGFPSKCYQLGGHRISLPVPPGNRAPLHPHDVADADPHDLAIHIMPHPRMQLPAVTDTCIYFELSQDDVWAGSMVLVHDVTLLFGGDDEIIQVNDVIIDDWMFANKPCRALQESLFWYTSGQQRGPGPLPCTCTRAHGCSNVTTGILINLFEGSVSFHHHGRVGPRVMFGEGWEAGVEVRTAGEYPEGEGCGWSATLSQPRQVPPGMYAAAFLDEFVRNSDDEDTDEEIVE